MFTLDKLSKVIACSPCKYTMLEMVKDDRNLHRSQQFNIKKRLKLAKYITAFGYFVV